MPRMTIEFPERAKEAMDRLAKEDHTTKADVLRRALALYDYVHREALEKDRRLTITDKITDKVYTDIVFP